MELIKSKVQQQLQSNIGIDGLTIGAGMGEDNGEGPSDADDVTAFNVTYAMDAVSVGYSSYEVTQMQLITILR